MKLLELFARIFSAFAVLIVCLPICIQDVADTNGPERAPRVFEVVIIPLDAPSGRSCSVQDLGNWAPNRSSDYFNHTSGRKAWRKVGSADNVALGALMVCPRR